MANNTANSRLFNIDLLFLTKDMLRQMAPVTKLNIFVSNTQNFEPEGLFSTEIFGPPGNNLRNQKFGYVNLGTEVFHPLIFEHYTKLKSLYKDIMMGNKYVLFDEKEKDFVLSDMTNGHTGYSYFVKHANKLKLSNNDSDQRHFRIELIKKYNYGETLLSNWLVLPAGLRDYMVDKNGKPSEDEVNDLYRKLITSTQILREASNDTTKDDMYDKARYKAQTILLDIYLYFKTMLDGKNKFIQGKFAKRAVAFGTRNVITPSVNMVKNLDDENVIDFNDTICGLYQFVKSIGPIAKNKVHSKFIGRIMNPDTTTAYLVNKKSMQTEAVDLKIKKRDEWLSLEGLDHIMNKLGQEDLRAHPVMINDHYMFLMYDDGKTITVIYNTAGIPDDMDRKYIRPITYAELFYLAIYDVRKKYNGFLTRYPVAGLGGIYPTRLYVKTTEIGRTVTWKQNGTETTVVEYPILSKNFVNSLSPHYTKLSRLDGDFDGFTRSY